MWIALLGPLAVADDDGRAVTVNGARLRGLLAVLALAAGRPVPAERITEALWPDLAPSANAVQSLVSRLRTTLGGRDRIPAAPGGYRLAAGPGDVDAHRFTDLADAGRAALAAGDHRRAAADLRAAVDLWRSEHADALTGIADDAATRLAAAREEALADLADAGLALGEAATVLPGLRDRAAAAPLRERTQAQLMRALADTGRRAEALDVYETTRARLADELGVDPSPLLRETHRTVLRGTTAPHRPQRRTPPLPTALTSFIGRDDDLAAITGLMDASRLLTLTGPGGAGKTRLAVNTAAACTDTDVEFLELAPVADPAEVPYALLTALDLHDTAIAARRTGGGHPSAATDPVGRAMAALGRRRALLVLDNCEHLIDATAALAARLLAGCPRLRILATSREPLGLTGETLYPVAPLPYPDGTADPAEALTYPAVRLLADRAAAARPGFTPDTGNIAALTEICRRLDGLPLAIELAAARLRALTPADLAARLDERFRLLTGGDRTALPRHRTLRAVVDWSWELLDADERDLLRRLSVFAGGASLTAVTAVSPTDPVDALTALVDKSLVIHGSDGRYRLLETIRAYAAERLADDPARRTAAHDAHTAHFLALAHDNEPHLRDHRQLTALDTFTTEHDNLIAALRRAFRTRDAAVATGLVGALGWFWWLRGRRAEASPLCREALALGADAPPRDRALAHFVAAFCGFDAPDVDRAAVVGHLEEARRLRDEHGLAPREPLLRMIDLISAILSGADQDAVVDMEALLDDPDPWLRATAYSFRGSLLINLGRLTEAREALDTATRLFEEVGDRWGRTLAGSETASLALWSGDVATATTLYGRAVSAEDELGVDSGLSQQRPWLAACRALQDPPGEGERMARRCLADARAVSEHNNVVLSGVILAGALRRRGELDEAAAVLDQVEDDVALCPGPPHHSALHRAARAAVALAAGDAEEADVLVRYAVRDALDTGDGPILADTVETWAAVELALGRPELAARRLGHAEVVRGLVNRASPELAATAAAARDALGEEGFAAAYAAGLGPDRPALLAAMAGEVGPGGQDSFAR